jgi:flagellar M-ring protein FliF
MGQRMAVCGAAVGTLALLGALIIYGSQPEYAVLFSDLKPTDAQTIVDKLKASNVPYKLTSGGTSISVPTDRVSELRLQVAASGALSGGHVGFDIFDKSSFGSTDFAQQVNYQRAIEGELARTLEGMEELETARVHITRPRESIFTDKAERAKASVMVKVRQSKELSRERTEAIVSLISSAVESLDPSDVSVLDTRGRLLSAPGRSGSGGAGDVGAFNSQLEARRKLETEAAARIVSLLEPISGVGHVRADVSADLDFSQMEQTEEKYDPKSQVIRSQQTAQEVRNQNAAGQGGVTGARANDPATETAAPPLTAQNGSNDQRAATTTNYEIDKTLRRTIAGGGRITRLSVSVVVDYKSANGVTAARSPEELQKIQELVAAATGINASRGDQIVVQTIPFDQPTVEVTNRTFVEKNRELINTAIKYGALVLAALLLVIFVIRPARRALRLAAKENKPRLLPASTEEENRAITSGEASEVNALLTGSIDGQSEMGMDGVHHKTVAQLEAEMEAKIERELSDKLPEVRRAGAIKRQLTERSQTEAEIIAMTLRGWVQESR